MNDTLWKGKVEVPQNSCTDLRLPPCALTLSGKCAEGLKFPVPPRFGAAGTGSRWMHPLRDTLAEAGLPIPRDPTCTPCTSSSLPLMLTNNNFKLGKTPGRAEALVLQDN